jgi:chromosome partitioning protein
VVPHEGTETPVTRIVAVASQKGGVGKTTTVASLGVALSALGDEVLLVDLDPQACLTFSLGVDPEDLAVSLHDVLAGRALARDVVTATADDVDLLPATIELAQTEATLIASGRREHTLDDALAPLRGHYDWILLDCPPTLGILTVNALTAADEVIVPLQCETLAHRGLGQLVETVDQVMRTTNPRLRVSGILPTMFDGRTSHARAVLADVVERYDVPVLEPPVPRSVRFAEAPALGRSVLATSPYLRGAEAYRLHAQRMHDSLTP